MEIIHKGARIEIEKPVGSQLTVISVEEIKREELINSRIWDLF